ncbi:hypothetical protein PC123_g14634 [Phytophthora cactorum]|nr:hypothetical protein PC123_g14634 [Phytophthora cactorum]
MKLRRWRRQVAPARWVTKVDQTSANEEDVERASCVGNSVPHGAVSASDVAIETSHDVGNEVPRRGRRRRHRRRRKSSLNNIQTGVQGPSDSAGRSAIISLTA